MFIFLLKVFGWYIPGISGGPTWTPPPFITCGTVQLFFDFFTYYIFSCTKCHAIPEAWRIIRSAPLSRAHRSASPAVQRRAVPREAVPCRALPCPARALPCPARALPCGTVRCCAMLCRAACFLLYFSYHMPSAIRSVIPPVLLLYVPGIMLLNNGKKSSHSSVQPSYNSSAVQRRAVLHLRNGPAFL